jgi:outer membrane protein TolC
MRRSRSVLFGTALLNLITIVFLPTAKAETLTLKRALELASTRSTNVGMAVADEVRAHSSYVEARSAYIPGAVIGSGLGKSIGFPLTLEGSAPSLFNINAQSTVWNMAQRSFVRAARDEWNATGHNTDDQRNQALLDAAVTYAQLDAAQAKAKILADENEQAQRAEYIERQRVDQGVDSKLDLTRASLNAARARMKLAETQGNVDIIKQHLAQLTGLPSSDIVIDGETVPRIPDLSQDEGVINRALANSSALKVAEERQKGREQQAKGEHNALYPTVDFAAQYARLARYNNYDQFFKKFEPDNATIGVVMRLPFLNPQQRAKAQTAAADALRAKSETDAVRNQVSAQTLKVQRSLPQLAAARDVAKLEWELAQGDLDAVTAKLQTGTANLRDQENARIEVNDKYATYLDTTFEYDKARLQLMSMTGDLQGWAASAK